MLSYASSCCESTASRQKLSPQHDLTSSTLKKALSVPDDDTLVLSVNDHVSVHIICKSIDVGWVFVLCLEKQNKTKSNHGQIKQHIRFFFSWPWCIPLYAVPMLIIISYRLHNTRIHKIAKVTRSYTEQNKGGIWRFSPVGI